METSSSPNVGIITSTSQAFADATARLRRLNHFDILEYCLGFEKHTFPKLLENCVLVSFSIEHGKSHPVLWSELGFSILQRREAQEHIATPGHHSENLMRSASFGHLRVQENMRFLNVDEDACDIHSHRNRFGQTRFTSEQEAKNILRGVLTKQPVVLLTFYENYDPLELPLDSFNCVVATISTQCIARERNIDWNMNKRKGLEDMCRFLGFQCNNLDGPSNYAGFNLVAAIQMGMRWRFRSAEIPLQTTVNELQIESQCRDVSWGERLFCFKCGSHDHSAFDVHNRCTCDMEWEAECTRCWTLNNNVNHTISMCPHFSSVIY